VGSYLDEPVACRSHDNGTALAKSDSPKLKPKFRDGSRPVNVCGVVGASAVLAAAVVREITVFLMILAVARRCSVACGCVGGFEMNLPVAHAA